MKYYIVRMALAWKVGGYTKLRWNNLSVYTSKIKAVKELTRLKNRKDNINETYDVVYDIEIINM